METNRIEKEKISCYCYLYGVKDMCAAHTAQKWHKQISNNKSIWRKLFGLSKHEKEMIKRLERIMYD